MVASVRTYEAFESGVSGVVDAEPSQPASDSGSPRADAGASSPRADAGAPLRASRLRPADLGALDHEIYEGTDSYGHEDFSERRFGWIAAAVEHHISASETYAKLCAAKKFTIEALRASRDLSTVPLISSGTFKKKRISSSVAGPVKECTSSGTRGTKSVVPRDDRTLERYAGSVVHGMTEFFGKAERRKAFVLGPETKEAGDLWFSYSLSLAGMLYETDYFVRDGRFDAEELHAALSRIDDEIESPIIVAPPALLIDFCEWMRAAGHRLDLGVRESFTITAGGWKRRASELVKRDELAELVEERLGIPTWRQRDFFNMVELNTVVFECEHLRKHVPPWLEVIVRRPADMSVAAPSEEGILTYLDPTAASYPCFVLSDDFGSLDAERCPCGRRGPTMRLHRRLVGIEERGCSLKMDRYATGERK